MPDSAAKQYLSCDFQLTSTMDFFMPLVLLWQPEATLQYLLFIHPNFFSL